MDLEHLERALAAVESSEAALEHAKVLLDCGSALHRAGRDDAARRHFRRGLDLADGLGAHLVSSNCLAGLMAAGGRPRRVRTTGPEALTPAERRVVDLAS